VWHGRQNPPQAIFGLSRRSGALISEKSITSQRHGVDPHHDLRRARGQIRDRRTVQAAARQCVLLKHRNTLEITELSRIALLYASCSNFRGDAAIDTIQHNFHPTIDTFPNDIPSHGYALRNFCGERLVVRSSDRSAVFASSDRSAGPASFVRKEHDMRASRYCLPLLLATSALAAVPTASFAQVVVAPSVSVGFEVTTATIAPPPLPVYEQPAIPAEGYIWTPGYWAYSDGYYWVPGTWVQPPSVGVLWTPGYWGFTNGSYGWNAGYWGPTVGFYGGINYGFGYGGVGYEGGNWQNGHFAYNRAVNNFGNVHVTNVYNRTVVNNYNSPRASFNGGNGGVIARPTAQQEAYAREKHTPATSAQREQVTAAHGDRSMFATENHGHPAVAATPRPGELHGSGVVAAKDAARPDATTEARPAGGKPNEPARADVARPGETTRTGETARPESSPTGRPPERSTAGTAVQHPATRAASSETPRPAERGATETTQRPAVHEATRPEAAHPVEHGAAKPTTQHPAVHEATRPETSKPEVHGAAQPTARTPAVHEATRPETSKPEVHGAVQPTARIPAVHAAARPTAPRPAVHEAARPAAPAVHEAARPAAPAPAVHAAAARPAAPAPAAHAAASRPERPAHS